LEKLINDFNIANNLNEEFHKQISKDNTQLPFDFNVQVLSMPLWRISYQKIMLPQPFSYCMESFNQFFELHHQKIKKKKLKWAHHLGTCQILARYENGDKILSTSLYQV